MHHAMGNGNRLMAALSQLLQHLLKSKFVIFYSFNGSTQ
jgi:hypothetical protein